MGLANAKPLKTGVRRQYIMPWTTKNMSSLDELGDNSTDLVLATIFQDIDRGLPNEFVVFRRLFIRLCDKSIFEYRTAKKTFESSGSKVFRGMRFTDHMENSINAMRRCYRLFDRLKNLPNLLIVDRTARKHLEKLVIDLLPIRDTIEHFEERLVSDVGKKDSIMLSISKDDLSFQIGTHSMEIIDFERAIIGLHSIANILVSTHEEYPAIDA